MNTRDLKEVGKEKTTLEGETEVWVNFRKDCSLISDPYSPKLLWGYINSSKERFVA